MRQDAEPPQFWAIRQTVRADTDVLAASVYIAERTGIQAARA